MGTFITYERASERCVAEHSVARYPDSTLTTTSVHLNSQHNPSTLRPPNTTVRRSLLGPLVTQEQRKEKKDKKENRAKNVRHQGTHLLGCERAYLQEGPVYGHPR